MGCCQLATRRHPSSTSPRYLPSSTSLHCRYGATPYSKIEHKTAALFSLKGLMEEEDIYKPKKLQQPPEGSDRRQFIDVGFSRQHAPATVCAIAQVMKTAKEYQHGVEISVGHQTYSISRFAARRVTRKILMQSCPPKSAASRVLPVLDLHHHKVFALSRMSANLHSCSAHRCRCSR